MLKTSHINGIRVTITACNSYPLSRQEETRFQLVSNSQVRRDKMKNNNVTEKDLFYILDLFEHMKVTYWLDGGWG